ncbi:MAG: MFS transporter [Hyphomicrobiales bacterium]|nr:MFS transporter [Hyphomicrobiales bacterium]
MGEPEHLGKQDDLDRQDKWRGWLFIGALMLAGEAIYMLPYMRKTFQTSMEQVFAVSATQLGLLNSMFGILALACYFPGGWLADRFPARRLLTFSLVATSAGGFYMASVPSYGGLLAVHAFWGVTSILTFWAALIKAARAWGGPQHQGVSFGLLDGGRGLVDALLVTAATVAFAYAGATKAGLVSAIYVYSIAPLAGAVAIWFLVPDSLHEMAHTPAGERHPYRVRAALALPETWLLALVILTSYLLYIGTFDFPAFAEKAYGQTKLFGAQLATFRDWLRPLAALAAGLLADRISPTRAIMGAFVLLIGGYGTLAVLPANGAMMAMLWIEVFAVAIAVFALRGVYYSLLQAGGVPLASTGTVVGIVSVVGYTPDIFGHLMAGLFVDNFAGVRGYHMYFGFLSIVACGGFFATLAIHLRHGKS